MGCSIASYTDDEDLVTQYFMIRCIFNQPGFRNLDNVYKNGVPCTNCRPNVTRCSDGLYGGLCEIIHPVIIERIAAQSSIVPITSSGGGGKIFNKTIISNGNVSIISELSESDLSSIRVLYIHFIIIYLIAMISLFAHVVFFTYYRHIAGNGRRNNTNYRSRVENHY